jgi:uncharacterized protein (TIGR03435 family)
MQLGIRLVALGVLAGAQVMLCQESGAKPKFEVVSVKPGTKNVGKIEFRPASLSVSSATLGYIIAEAYTVDELQITGIPSGMQAARYDIEAKTAGGPATRPILRLMLQSALAQRFGLVLHQDVQTRNVTALQVANSGPKLIAARDQVTPPPRGAGILPLRSVDMHRFASILSVYIQVPDDPRFPPPVIDETGLDGYYDIDLEFMPLPHDDSLEALKRVVRRYGLELVPKKAAIKILVVDRVTYLRQTENLDRGGLRRSGLLCRLEV